MKILDGAISMIKISIYGLLLMWLLMVKQLSPFGIDHPDNVQLNDFLTLLDENIILFTAIAAGLEIISNAINIYFKMIKRNKKSNI